MERNVDVAVIGAGSAGNFSLSQIVPARKSFVIINSGPTGTTCARVGCMPSKAAIHVADDFASRDRFPKEGIQNGGELDIDGAAALNRVRQLRDGFVKRVLGKTIDKMGPERFIDGQARFLEPTLLAVGDERIRAGKVIIASGSSPVVPAPWQVFGERVLTTDTVFEMKELPESLAVIGLGAIGIELGQAYSRLGVDVVGIDILETVSGITDPAVRAQALATFRDEFPLWLGHPAEIEEGDGGLVVSAGGESKTVEKILVAMGRKPNIGNLDLGVLGVPLSDDGMPQFDPETMRIGDLPVFIAGDVTGDRAVLHEAADEGRIAGYNAARDEITRFRRKTPLAITFCDPEIAIVGFPWQDLDEETTAVGLFDMAMSGRAIIMDGAHGLLRVYGEKSDGRLLGATFFGPGAEHLGHQFAWALERELSVFDMIAMPYYHPVIEEAFQNALVSLAEQVENAPPRPWELQRI